MDIQSVENKFSEYLIPSIFHVEKDNKFVLKEDNQKSKNVSYELSVKQNNKKSLIVIRPDKLKSVANYIKKSPKDCDYILFDVTNRTLFLMELKHSTGTATQKEVKKQLISGKKWFDHILFLIGLDFDDIKDYKVFLMHICVAARQDRKQPLRPNMLNCIYKLNGKVIDLREFYKRKNGIITLEQFDKVIKK